jgi:YfiR/HmsC-like
MAILCDRQIGKSWPPPPLRLEPDFSHATGNIACYPGKQFTPGTRTLLETILILSLIFASAFRNFAQDSGPTEYQIKAAFLYNFAKFVKWPSQAFASPTSPIVIGVLGKNVFGDDLEDTIRNKTINNHPFEFKEFRSVQAATNCQILFISPSEKNQLPNILKGLLGTSVLTVGETDHFTEAGGMINFVIENDEVHFQINDKAAKKAGLEISSKLLSLAVHHP